MAQPQTFREAREQLDKLNEEWADGNGGISDRRYDEDRNELDTQIAAMVHGKEALLDAAPEILQVLEAILSDDGVDRLQAFTINGQFRDPRETISAVIAKAKGETA